MKRWSKAFTAAVLIILLSVCYFRTVDAAVQMRVTCDETHAQAGKALVLTLKAENNPGLMGFGLRITYDPSVLTSPQITSGEITKTGTLNNSIGVSETGSFDVIWTNTVGVSKDDVLFSVVFIASSAPKNTAVDISFSALDTFTESWETVEIAPLKIPITFSLAETDPTTQQPGEINSTEETVQDSPPETADVSNVSGAGISDRVQADALITAVEKALEEANITRLAEVSEEETEAFVDRVNELSAAISDGDAAQIASFDELLLAYTKAVQDAFTKEIIEAVDAERIVSIINDALNAIGAGSVETVPEDQQQAFLQTVQDALLAEAPELQEPFDKIEPDGVVQVLTELKNSAENSKNNPVSNNQTDTSFTEELNPSGKKKTTGILTAILIGTTILFVFSFICIIRRKGAKR